MNELSGFAPETLLKIIIDAVHNPIIMVNQSDQIIFANTYAEQFFNLSETVLKRTKLESLLPYQSPILQLVNQAKNSSDAISEYRVDLSSPRLGSAKIVDVYLQPVSELPGYVVMLLQEKSLVEKLNRQMIHRGAARSVTGLAAMLAHEIKNPLAGIRGAAQLLQSVISDEDRQFTRLIIEETDRIVNLVDRMEIFSDERVAVRTPVNIHAVFETVRLAAQTSFAKKIKFIERFDPSLPPVYGNRDQLVQIVLNLVKNAAEAVSGQKNGAITFMSSYHSGIRLYVAGQKAKLALPIEFCVEDNGPGISEELLPHIFEPFITSKVNGTGLGLALVAKLVNAHGGVIECDTNQERTCFRVLLPVWQPDMEKDEE